MKKLLLWMLLIAMLMGGMGISAVAQPPAQPPALSAKAAALTDGEGKLLYGLRETERLPMASTTKIMTALLAAEDLSPTQPIRIPPQAVGIEGSSVYLREGEILRAEELLYALLLASANDAATALAIAVSGSEEAFVARMNEKASELGLESTHFANPHGLPHEDHYTTAQELALLASAALANETVRRIAATQYTTISLLGKEGGRCLRNHNKMLRLYTGAVGLKTGFTKISGRCLVSAAERDGMLLIAVTLDAPDDWRDHTALLDYGFANYFVYTVADVGEFHYEYPISGGTQESVTLVNQTPIRLTVCRADPPPKCTVEVFSHFAIAPVAIGDVAGKLFVTAQDGTTVSSVLLYGENVAKKPTRRGFLARIFS